jgi:hypothetical protein
MTLGANPDGRALRDEGLARDKDQWFLTCGPWTSPSPQVIHGFIPKRAAGFFPIPADSLSFTTRLSPSARTAPLLLYFGISKNLTLFNAVTYCITGLG